MAGLSQGQGEFTELKKNLGSNYYMESDKNYFPNNLCNFEKKNCLEIPFVYVMMGLNTLVIPGHLHSYLFMHIVLLGVILCLLPQLLMLVNVHVKCWPLAGLLV